VWGRGGCARVGEGAGAGGGGRGEGGGSEPEGEGGGVRQRQNKKRQQVGTRPEGSKTTKRASGGQTSAKQMTKNRNMA